MKAIPLRTEPMKSVDVFRQVLGQSPRDPLTVEHIRARCRVLDRLDACEGDVIELEDEDAKTLSKALNSFPWAIANRDILRIIDDVINAKAPPTPATKISAVA